MLPIAQKFSLHTLIKSYIMHHLSHIWTESGLLYILQVCSLPTSMLRPVHSREKTLKSQTLRATLHSHINCSYFGNLPKNQKSRTKIEAHVPITVRSYRLMLSGTHVWQILFGYQVPNRASHFLCKSQPQQYFSAPVPSLHAYRAAFLHQTHKSSRVQKRGGQVGPELPLFSHTTELFILSSVILSQPTHTLLSFCQR